MAFTADGGRKPWSESIWSWASTSVASRLARMSFRDWKSDFDPVLSLRAATVLMARFPTAMKSPTLNPNDMGAGPGRVGSGARARWGRERSEVERWRANWRGRWMAS